MLRFAEEIMLLILDEAGDFVRVPTWPLHCALGGGVLMDLALEGRIDTDTAQLFVVDATPVGDDLLDSALHRIARSPDTFDADHWVRTMADSAGQIRARVLERLVDHGILECRERSFLWVLRSRRYPTLDARPDREVKRRLMSVLFSDDIPDPRDSAIVALADTCGIFEHLLSEREVRRTAERVALVGGLDLMLQAVSSAVREGRTMAE